jgi:hypothetical protein
VITITLYGGAKQPIPINVSELTWPELVQGLRDLVSRRTEAPETAREETQKEALLAWSPVRLSKPYRLLENVEAVTALVIDVDNADVDAISKSITLLGLAAVIYGSPRDHVEGLRRVRVVSPITRDLAPSESRAARLRFAELLGVGPGCGVEEACSAEKIFFAGRMHDAYYASLDLEPEREFAANDGEPVDVDALLAEPLALEWGCSPAEAAKRIEYARVERAEMLRPKDSIVHASEDVIGSVIGAHESFRGRRHDLSGAVAGSLRKLGVPRTKGEELGRAWLREKWDEHGAWFMGAWGTSADAVSGRTALAAIVGEASALALAQHFAPRIVAAPAAPVIEAPSGFPVVGLDTDRKGDPRPTISNAEMILNATLDGKIKFDTHRRRMVVAGVHSSIARLPDGPWLDHYTTELTAFFETFGLRMRSSVVLEAVERHAHRHEFNPVLDYAEQCAAKWDGVPRVDHALETYWRTTDPHAALVSRVFFLSMAKRMIEPGCAVHTVLVLTSEDQGKGKSRSLEALVPVRDWWADSPIDIGNKDGFQNLTGKVIYEIGEAASSNRRDTDTLKQYFSSSQDTYRGSFKRFAEDVARTCVFVITANNMHGILRDATGERRYMPISITDEIDVEGIARDRDMLIGEAVVRAGVWDERYWLSNEEASALAPAHRAISEHDALEGVISAWIDGRDGNVISWADLASFNGPLRCNVDELEPKDQRRVREIMRRLGWRLADAFDEKRGARVRAFVR